MSWLWAMAAGARWPSWCVARRAAERVETITPSEHVLAPRRVKQKRYDANPLSEVIPLPRYKTVV